MLAVHHFNGVAGRASTSSVSATIRTPDWQPRLNGGTFLYDWVMEHGGENTANPWLVQVGWITGGGAPKVAVYAWVGGTGGWESYVELPTALAFGSDHAYKISYRGANWWDVWVDGQVVASYNLPSGPTGLPQSYVETDSDNPTMPDLRTADLNMGATDLYTDAPFSCPAYIPGSVVYTRH